MALSEIERNHGATLGACMRAHSDFNEAIASIIIRVIESKAIHNTHEINTHACEPQSALNVVVGWLPRCPCSDQAGEDEADGTQS